jgi:hypothetical protein
MVLPCLKSDRVGTWLAGGRHLPAFRSQPRPLCFIGNCLKNLRANLTVSHTFQWF